ncbi:hypothetical protein [Bacillus pumilus]|uniref:hypothetical protein n=1 Tax=Bacillus pumilus TaxID=1408 RepID=UPI001C244415|nr:hypothetical protein [Bacillus pumilus]MBU8696150.1 hypothetical protein [Bacillus pumilus]
MKKLLLVLVISLGLFSGLTSNVSAAENNNQNQTHSTIMNTSNSIHEKAFELKNNSRGQFFTYKSNPIKYFKFYFTGSDGVTVLVDSKYSHKVSILNGKFIQVGLPNMALAPDLTYGWNYIEIVDTRPRIGASYFNLEINWL